MSKYDRRNREKQEISITDVLALVDALLNTATAAADLCANTGLDPECLPQLHAAQRTLVESVAHFGSMLDLVTPEAKAPEAPEEKSEA
jgi:hypothetical protein